MMVQRKRHGGKKNAWSGQGPAAAVVEESGRVDQEGWQRPWVPWAVGLGLLLVGTAVGWGSSYLALSPILGQPTSTIGLAGKVMPGGEGAAVEPAMPAGAAPAEAAPGDQVTLTWQVRNTGGSAWAADSYRFSPADSRTAVMPLPHTVQAGESVTIQTVLTVPEMAGLWQPAWQLTGPKRPVPGGVLAASFQIRAPHPDPGDS